MRTVKTAAQLAALKGEGPDHVERLCRQVETMTKEAQQSAEKNQVALLRSLELVQSIARQMKEPVKVTTVHQEAEKIKSWKFTCDYDGDGKLVNIVADATG